MSSVLPLGELLVGAGTVTRDQLDLALKEQGAHGGRLGQALLALGFLDERALALAVGKQLGLRVIDLDRVEVAPEITHLLRLDLAEQYGLVPVGQRPDGTLVVACFDPTNAAGPAECRAAIRHPIELCVATASSVDRAIRRFYYGETSNPSAGIEANGVFTITRTSLEAPPPPVTPAGELESRLAALEREVAFLKRAFAARLPGGLP